jgi:hypothetical protein
MAATVTSPRFEFRPLKENQIRLLKLEPGLDGVLECELLDVPIPAGQDREKSSVDERLHYEALSYRWGSSHLKEEIRIYPRWWHTSPGMEYTWSYRMYAITSSLAAALRELRLSDEPRWLWIDQICINQRDDGEKSKQMDLMGLIYRHATRVIVWLGQVREEDDMDWENISSRPHDAEEAVAAAFIVLDSPDRQIEREPGRVGLTRRGFEILFSRAWFQRTWVIQESTLPAKESVILRCGPYQAAFDNLRRVLEKGSVFTKDRIYRGLAQATRFVKLQANLRDMEPGPERLLVGLRLLSGWFLASEIRDRYYGLLGLLDDKDEGSDVRGPETGAKDQRSYVNGGEPYTKVQNYRFDTDAAGIRKPMSDKAFFTNLAADLVIRFQTLDFLDGASGPYVPELHLPSWVPTWNVRMAAMPLAYDTRHKLPGLLEATVCEGQLRLCGLPLGSITWSASYWRGSSGLPGQETMHFLDEDQQAAEGMESHLLSIFPNVEMPTHALSLALGNVPARSDGGLDRLTQSEWLVCKARGFESILHARIAMPDEAVETRVADHTIQHGLDKMAGYIRARCSRRSGIAFQELAGVQMGRETDWGADGAKTFKARYLERATVFMTSEARFGYMWKPPTEQDQVLLVPGCARALVVRPTSEWLDSDRTERTFRVVGHCEIVGFTDARDEQHIELWRREQTNMEWFTLV